MDITRDVRIPGPGGRHTLSADVYRPRCREQVPALLSLIPYRKDAGVGSKMEASLRWLAERGYACLVVELGGIGASDGDMRPPFDAGEADDALAALEWVAAQPWCSGLTGMWGGSYAAILTMRAATKNPPSLKAIIPNNGLTDAGRSFIHPHGALGGMAGVTYWGTLTLANQVLPPLHGFHDDEQNRRWRRRLEEFEPWVVDLARHGPSAQAWRDRAFDASAIEVPALCVAGWRDLFHEDQIRAYDAMRGPKKLIVGPWMHSSPQSSPFEPVDFLSIMLRWWDYWLRGIDNGVMDEPAVSVYVQGCSPEWRGYRVWPPAGDELRLDMFADGYLREGVDADCVASAEDASAEDASAEDASAEDASAEDAIAEYHPDPTIGSLGGLWSLAGDVVGLPLDQHDDDMRGVAATSHLLDSELLLAGRPTVTVRLSSQSVTRPERLVAYLTDVDRAGRSKLITSGVLCPSGDDRVFAILLNPTAHRVSAGHRVRVVVGDSEFPRLWPLPNASPLRIAAIELKAPTATVRSGECLQLPQLGGSAERVGSSFEPTWLITRDPVQGGVEIVMGDETVTRTSSGHELTIRQDFRASVCTSEPDAARIVGTVNQAARLTTGEIVDVVVTTELTTTTLRAEATVKLQGSQVYSRRWDVPRSVDL